MLHSTRSPRSLCTLLTGIAFAIPSLTCATTSAGQDPVRVNLPPRAVEKTVERELPPLVFVKDELSSSKPLGDEPDFAPMEEYKSKDGHHTLLRPKGNPYVLSFTNGDYTPEPGIDPTLLDMQRAGIESTFGYVMIKGRMADEKIATLRGLGVDVLDVHTWQSVVARIPLARLQTLMRLPFVHWVGHAQLPQKLGVRLAREMPEAGSGAPLDLLVTVFVSDMGPAKTSVVIGETREIDRNAVELQSVRYMPNGAYQKALEKLGFEPTFYDQDTYTFMGKATRALVTEMQKLDFVRVLELNLPDHAAHDQTMAMIGQDRIRGSWPGVGVPVGIIDTGIDSSPWHRDFLGKGFLGWRSSNSLPSSFEDANGHGTHVAGTVFGGGLADKRYTGAAPLVGNWGEGDRIFIGRYLDNTGTSAGSVKSLYDEFKTSHSYNGKSNPKRAIVNNSWGSRSSSGFTGTEWHSRTVDKIVFDYNQTYVFSVGNKDNTANLWAEQPAVAKNVIAVGNVRDSWGATGRPGQISSTSRYSANDGRYKPEICAPGTALTSAKKNTVFSYVNMSGTSMASPTVVGALASLMDRDSGFKYEPAAVKAAAIVSATIGGTLNFDPKRGYGMINSYKLNKVSKTSYGVYFGTLTQSGNYYLFDIPISGNLAAIRATLVMIEPKASSLASKARRNDIRMYIDIPPYSSGGKGGDYTVSSSVQTVLTYNSNGGSLTQAARGKVVRFKVYAQSIKSVDDVKIALAVIQYFKAPSASKKPTLAVTPSETVMLPSNILTLDTELISHATADDFNNGRVWVDGPSSWKMQSIQRTTADSIVQNYDLNNTHPSANFPRVKTGSTGGMTIGAGNKRKIKFRLLSPGTEGEHNVVVKATYHSGTLTQTLTKTLKICVDNSAPNKATNLKSTTHTVGVWSNDPKFTFTWNSIKDNGCAGIDRQHYELSNGAIKHPNIGSPSLSPAQGWAILNANASSSGWYFSVNAEDKVGFWAPTASIGPFRIDLKKPLTGLVSINNGDPYTSKLGVKVKLAATDAHSGVDKWRFSLNGFIWSSWMNYSANGILFSLDNPAWGGNGNEGVHKVYARVKDRAGNVSNVGSSIITYFKAPILRQATIASLPSVNADYYTLTGSNLTGVKEIEFAGKTITSKYQANHNSSWVNGYFRIFGSTAIRFYPPQGLAPGDYAVTVKNLAAASNSLTLKVTGNPTSIIRSAHTMLKNGLQTLIVTRGNQPFGTTCIIMASTSNLPSVLPGVYKFDIGNNFTNFVLLPEIAFNNLGHAKIAFPVVPAMVGIKAYFQAGYLNKRTTQTWPMPTSDVWSTSYIQ